jgi:hypothetical protein
LQSIAFVEIAVCLATVVVVVFFTTGFVVFLIVFFSGIFFIYKNKSKNVF